MLLVGDYAIFIIGSRRLWRLVPIFVFSVLRLSRVSMARGLFYLLLTNFNVVQLGPMIHRFHETSTMSGALLTTLNLKAGCGKF